MTDTRYQSGAFVFARARGVEPRRPEEIEPLLAKHGLNPDIAPAYSGDRAAVGRAFTAAKAGLSKEGLLLRPIKRTSHELVFGVVKETPDVADQSIEHQFEAVVSWAVEPDPSAVHGDHPIALRVAAIYQELRGKITADDWSGAITEYLEDHDAARVRSDGRVYWVPPQKVDDVRKLGDFLAEISIDLVVCQLEAEARCVAQGAAQDSLDDQLARLQREVAEFDGTQRPSTYTRRLEEFQRLRQRAILYRDALGCGVDRAETVLTELEQKVSNMLELRTSTVVPSSTPPAPRQEPKTSAPEELRFAGAVFRYRRTNDDVAVFGSDDDDAHSKVKMLERIGVAGRWQTLGRTSVRIQNSGPPGELISIRVKLPNGSSLAESAQSLSVIGIEVLAAE